MREKSIELLNRAVADELTAIHQYMYLVLQSMEHSTANAGGVAKD